MSVLRHTRAESAGLAGSASGSRNDIWLFGHGPRTLPENAVFHNQASVGWAQWTGRRNNDKTEDKYMELTRTKTTTDLGRGAAHGIHCLAGLFLLAAHAGLLPQ
jgi:hypothetical protein